MRSKQSSELFTIFDALLAGLMGYLQFVLDQLFMQLLQLSFIQEAFLLILSRLRNSSVMTVTLGVVLAALVGNAD